MRKLAALAALLVVVYAGFAQEAASAPAPNAFAFAAGFNLGTDVITDNATGKPVSWTRFAFQPDLSFGKVGVGLDLTMHFQLYKDANTAVTFYGGDWVPNYEGNRKTFFDVYLPKILYVRYGVRGDPIYGKLGSIDDFTLGDGFIMSDYSNMQFLPGTRIAGLEFGVDGKAFNFPYVGLELAMGNLAHFDVIGSRVYGRPFLNTAIPILKDAEAGLTIVTDNDPYLYDTTKSTTAKSISVVGLDVSAPIVQSKLFPVVAFTDVAFEPNASLGAMVGAGGKLFSFINYGAQIRLLQDGFIPSYFDSSYDIYRSIKYDYMLATKNATKTFYPAWYSSLGFSFFEDKLAFSARLDGPFKAIPTVKTNSQADYPHLKAVATLAEGVLGGFSLGAHYEKYYLGAEKGFFPDMVDPTDSIVGMDVNYHTGAAILTLTYNAKYDPTATDTDKSWVVTSSLSATMKF